MKTSKCFDKRTGVTYVYEVLENYWDKDKKQCRNKKRLIGRWDPETEQIVPTSRQKKKMELEKKEQEQAGANSSNPDYQSMYNDALKDLDEKNKEIQSLNSQVELLKNSLSALSLSCLEIGNSVQAALDSISK